MSRFKPVKMWAVLLGEAQLIETISRTREGARGTAKVARRLRDLRRASYPVRIVRVEVRIHD